MFVAAQQGQAEEARLLRFPATNGSDIVFSYAGDLYKVSARGGEAKRLTSHAGSLDKMGKMVPAGYADAVRHRACICYNSTAYAAWAVLS